MGWTNTGAALLLVATLQACSGRGTNQIDEQALAHFAPLPVAMLTAGDSASEELVNLGRVLFYETRFSPGGDISCNSCHGLDTYGVDGRRVSLGHKGQEGTRNAPTVYNAAGHVAQFWDGRAADVEEQAKGPILNPVEMAMPSEVAVLEVVKGIPEYVERFGRAFPGEADPITYDNLARAIGMFERKLVTPSRWDDYLNGQRDALTAEEKAGFNTLVEAGCATCHHGPYLGGTMYQKLGAAEAWPDSSDLGRYDVTGREQDRLTFKVPSLRNIAETGPYFHDGEVETLEEAVREMGHHQLGNELTDDQVRSIVTWLEALTGTMPTEYIKPPETMP